VFARADDYFAGVLQSRFHEAWALKLGTRLETRPRYTPTSCFETFPFPWPLGQEPTDSLEVKAIAEAAAQLNEMRERWLNPPEWVRHQSRQFGASDGGVWTTRLVPGTGANSEAEYQTLVPIDAMAEKGLGTRTLTALYNEMPQWLRDTHDRLDHAVARAYVAAQSTAEWVNAVTGERMLDLLLGVNLSRAGAAIEDTPSETRGS
jgi:hypothetical protein